MKKTKVFFLMLLMANLVYSQNKFVKIRHNNHIDFIKLDSTQRSHTTVVEYNNFLILCELPLRQSSVKDGLEQEIQNAKELLEFLKETYNKPVNYIISSHWHGHSLSGIQPFLQKGAKIITTNHNWNKAVEKGVLPVEDKNKYNSQIITIDKDSLILSETSYPIRLAVMDTTYDMKPTDDYMMPYFIKDSILFISCMGAIKDIDYKKVTVFTYSSRLTDIARLVKEKQLPVREVIRLSYSSSCQPAGCAYAFPYSSIEWMLENGESPDETIESMSKMDEQVLIKSQDSILQAAIARQMHSNLFRLVSEKCLENKQYDKAIIFAKLLNLYYPGAAYYLNTLGKCYYLKGDIATAKYYHLIIRKKTDKYGMEEWQRLKKE